MLRWDMIKISMGTTYLDSYLQWVYYYTEDKQQKGFKGKLKREYLFNIYIIQ